MAESFYSSPHYILIKALDDPETSTKRSSGLLLPKDTKETVKRCTVIHCPQNDSGYIDSSILSVHNGDTVIVRKEDLEEYITLDGVHFNIVETRKVLGKVEISQ